jgi:hypothetical protein
MRWLRKWDERNQRTLEHHAEIAAPDRDLMTPNARRIWAVLSWGSLISFLVVLLVVMVSKIVG